jgi:thiosulfate/3-mercaptopyruvate sulfurtransferase
MFSEKNVQQLAQFSFFDTRNTMLLPLKASITALHSLQQSPRLLIVDLRPAEEYNNGHISGALWLDARRLNRSEKPVGGLLPELEAIIAIAADLGLRNDQHVVAYDAGRTTAAARLVWVLNAYNWQAISWLDGGFAAWLASGAPISRDSPSGHTGTDIAIEAVVHNMIDTKTLQKRLDDPALCILDVRSHAEYDGSDVRAEFGGHVPGAVNLEWTEMLEKSSELHDDESLQLALDELGITKDKDVVVYCQTHQRSALTYVALKHLGYKNVLALDGAWSNWGNDPNTPKTLGSKPYSS